MVNIISHHHLTIIIICLYNIYKNLYLFRHRWGERLRVDIVALGPSVACAMQRVTSRATLEHQVSGTDGEVFRNGCGRTWKHGKTMIYMVNTWENYDLYGEHMGKLWFIWWTHGKIMIYMVKTYWKNIEKHRNNHRKPSCWYIYLQNWVIYEVNVGIHIPAPLEKHTHDGSMVLEYLPTNWDYLENYYLGVNVGKYSSIPAPWILWDRNNHRKRESHGKFESYGLFKWVVKHRYKYPQVISGELWWCGHATNAQALLKTRKVIGAADTGHDI